MTTTAIAPWWPVRSGYFCAHAAVLAYACTNLHMWLEASRCQAFIVFLKRYYGVLLFVIISRKLMLGWQIHACIQLVQLA